MSALLVVYKLVQYAFNVKSILISKQQSATCLVCVWTPACFHPTTAGVPQGTVSSLRWLGTYDADWHVVHLLIDS